MAIRPVLARALAWWPPDPHVELDEHQVRELFAYLRPLTPPIMAEGKRRIRELVGPDEPIRVDHQTVKQLAGTRLGYVSVLKVISLSAGRPLEAYARFAIGVQLDHDGAIMVTSDLNPGRHLERWNVMDGDRQAEA